MKKSERGNSYPILSNLLELTTELIRSYFKDTVYACNTFSKCLLTADILFIIEPFKINNKNISISPLWKNYHAIHNPKAKIIILRSHKYDHPNCWDLLNLPQNFQRAIQEAQPAIEKWDIPVFGESIIDILQRFIKGHGKESLIAQLNSLRQSMEVAYSGLQNGMLTFEEITDEILPLGKKEWSVFLERWDKYNAYFPFLPFFPSFHDIERQFKTISDTLLSCSIEKATFNRMNLKETFEKMYQNLIEIDMKYIRPEIYDETSSSLS